MYCAPVGTVAVKVVWTCNNIVPDVNVSKVIEGPGLGKSVVVVVERVYRDAVDGDCSVGSADWGVAVVGRTSLCIVRSGHIGAVWCAHGHGVSKQSDGHVDAAWSSEAQEIAVWAA